MSELFLLPASALGRVAKRGHYAGPGTGPATETCGTCRHYVIRTMRSRRTFRKCGRMEAKWTGGPGSDIRKKDPACSGWEPLLAPAGGA